ncbi:MAG: C4-type zinc ribbon domain-containing protein [Ilumatobacter sp.]
MTHPILELQAADTMADQLKHRRDHLPEREQLQSAKNALVRWNEARMVTRRRVEELGATIEQAEADSKGIDKHMERLGAQMKTVIAPREAEALQHEIATLQQQRGELDDVELAALEEQTRLDDELSALLSQEESLTSVYIAADKETSEAETDIDGELARIEARLESLRAAVDSNWLKRYDRLRQHHMVAAATLSGSRCDGCHLDLSAAEIDTLRDEADNGGLSECPQCGRLLAP